MRYVQRPANMYLHMWAYDSRLAVDREINYNQSQRRTAIHGSNNNSFDQRRDRRHINCNKDQSIESPLHSGYHYTS